MQLSIIEQLGKNFFHNKDHRSIQVTILSGNVQFTKLQLLFQVSMSILQNYRNPSEWSSMLTVLVRNEYHFRILRIKLCRFSFCPKLLQRFFKTTVIPWNGPRYNSFSEKWVSFPNSPHQIMQVSFYSKLLQRFFKTTVIPLGNGPKQNSTYCPVYGHTSIISELSTSNYIGLAFIPSFYNDFSKLP